MQYPLRCSRRLALGALSAAMVASLAVPQRAAGFTSGDPSAELATTGASPAAVNWEDLHLQEARGPRRRAAARTSQPRWRPVPRIEDPAASAFAPEGYFFAPQAALRAQQVGVSFAGTDRQDVLDAFGPSHFLFTPPDTMAAVGPNHVVEAVNSTLQVFSRTGESLGSVTLDGFFTMQVGGIDYPRGGTSDPHLLYDRRSGHWFLCLIEFGDNDADNDLLLAVSRTGDPTGAWDRYVLPVGIARALGVDFFTDYPTMGLDDNGLYFGMNYFGSNSASNVFSKVAATGKSSLIAPQPFLGPVFLSTQIRDMAASPQPAVNLDAAGPTSPAWFVASSPFTSKSRSSGIAYRTVTWRGGTPVFSRTGRLATTSYGTPRSAPALGSTTPICTDDDRLLMAVQRGGRLWTCRTVATNRTGGAVSDRNGCEWLALDVSRAAPRLAQSGRVFDPAASAPRSYYYPSLAVNGLGSVVMGFSGSRRTEFAGAYLTGRLASDPAGRMGPVSLLKAGEAPYTLVSTEDQERLNRWGDYSATVVDPLDDLTTWTAQEYAHLPERAVGSIWGTWLAQVLAPAPHLTKAAAKAAAGQTGVILRLTGSGFFDPGDAFPNRLSVSFALPAGGDSGINGVQIRSATPTQVTVAFSVDPGTAPGPRDIVVTNPDGQSAVAAGGLTVQ